MPYPSCLNRLHHEIDQQLCNLLAVLANSRDVAGCQYVQALRRAAGAACQSEESPLFPMDKIQPELIRPDSPENSTQMRHPPGFPQ